MSDDWQLMKTAPTDGTFIIAALKVYRADDKSFLRWDVCVIARDTETGDAITMDGDYCGWAWEDFDVWKPINLNAAAAALKEDSDE